LRAANLRTVSPSAVAASPWIVRATWDLPLVVLTPALVFPLLLLWRAGSGDQVVYATVLAFGALGHHLPGMLRAYGDRALFARFRTRFLLAPLFLVLVCGGFSVAGLHGVAMVALVWGIWHGWMQTYGFARIYDHKRGSIARTTARIDFALCAAWFVGAVVVSPHRSFQILDQLARCGLPLPSAGTLDAATAIAWATLGASSLVYVVHAVRLVRAGTPASPQKHLLLGSSLGAWWIATNAVPSLVFGLALFELFHDVQYLAIVWAFNRRRASESANSGAFTRWLFRGGFTSAGLYVGLVIGYGALGPLAERVGEGVVRDALAGALVASQLLHFYFDGFIWKVRERDTSTGLGIASATAAHAGRRGLRHLALWSLFCGPLVATALTEREAAPETERAMAIATLLPGYAEAQTRAGLQFARAERPHDALAPLRRAHALDPGDETRRVDLARTLAEAADTDLRDGRALEGRAKLLEAHQLEPAFPTALRQLVAMRAEAKDLTAAMRAIDMLEMVAPGPDAHFDRARVLAQGGRLQDALAIVRAILATSPARLDVREFEQALLRSLGSR
jgi:tetratricopeptide (TPR) repeat protein